jgi:hypothetical protein
MLDRLQVPVERLAHAVQLLELEVAPVARHLDHAGDRVRVVGGEGGVEQLSPVEQPLGAGEVGDVGGDLAGEHRVLGHAQGLRALHLAVPVSTLDQPDGDAAPCPARQLGQPRDHVDGAFLVGLHREAEPVPAGEVRVPRQAREQVERGLQPLALLGVDRELDAARLGGAREVEDARQQLGFLPAPRRVLVTRVESGELDRQARPIVQALLRGAPGDPLQRRAVGGQIALRVGRGPRPLAQHVVGVAVTQLLRPARALDRLLDRLAQHELLAHDPHRLPHRLAHHRLAEPRDEPPEPGR